MIGKKSKYSMRDIKFIHNFKKQEGIISAQIAIFKSFKELL